MYRDRSELETDPISDILGLLKPASYGFRGLDAGGEWAIAFAGASGLKCQAIQKGACWLSMDGLSAPVRLEAGDLILLTGAEAFSLFTSSGLLPIDGYDFFLATPPGETAILNGGGSVIGVGGFFAFEKAYAGLLPRLLPPLIHIGSGATEGELIWPITRLMRELRTPQPGGALIAGHLAQTLLVEALRLYLTGQAEQGAAWLKALSDPRLRAAIKAMHAQPARRWMLDDLAAIAGMSRTSFATHFRTMSGEPAMEYLTRWRMLLAAERLRGGRETIAAVAATVGYESESAFGAAFKRVMGLPPRSFVRASA